MCLKFTLMQPTSMHCIECHMPFSNYIHLGLSWRLFVASISRQSLVLAHFISNCRKIAQSILKITQSQMQHRYSSSGPVNFVSIHSLQQGQHLIGMSKTKWRTNKEAASWRTWTSFKHTCIVQGEPASYIHTHKHNLKQLKKQMQTIHSLSKHMPPSQLHVKCNMFFLIPTSQLCF